MHPLPSITISPDLAAPSGNLLSNIRKHFRVRSEASRAAECRARDNESTLLTIAINHKAGFWVQLQRGEKVLTNLMRRDVTTTISRHQSFGQLSGTLSAPEQLPMNFNQSLLRNIKSSRPSARFPNFYFATVCRLHLNAFPDEKKTSRAKNP